MIKDGGTRPHHQLHRCLETNVRVFYILAGFNPADPRRTEAAVSNFLLGASRWDLLYVRADVRFRERTLRVLAPVFFGPETLHDSSV